MLYEYIIKGCICHLSAETIAVLEKERKAIEEEHKVWENMQKAYEIACRSNDPIDWSIYSDLYKDCYGHRP